MGKNDICVLLENGDLYVIDMNNIPKIISHESPIEHFDV
jgi:hypothetical protein